MITVPTLPTSQQQILVNLGNRYVVFGPSPGLPQALQFNPETDSAILPRVADESEIAEERIVQTLRMSGMKKSPLIEQSEAAYADIELIDDYGNRVIVDVKVQERDPKVPELDQARERLAAAAKTDQALEIWHFNIERLKLVIMRLEKGQLRIDELTPLDIWEKTAEGVFDRSRVLEEVNDWINRVTVLYEDVRSWFSKNEPTLRCEQSRTVIMSEEIMQRFAVNDREIAILDVLDADQVIASFVPRGLWLIGAWGRIDIITRAGTQSLLALGGPDNLQWHIFLPENPRQRPPFNTEMLGSIVGRS
jgi:hypothetical protein